ncbi:hypothetical protein CROQUDRAFT_86578 [Cronartium quercuum f. sp. fusiforme G11]|uniref:SH3 domain-containing protein n=1 Tax=Cronartium quercuum f. sp. fusiforme G11 TaxID=708437 RepID=A0A9P6TH99_9BASI|nr:hypothetical protein CROQUDRAFT_86578 [Cronartium quercuum f. sp. fusiforme G11]
MHLVRYFQQKYHVNLRRDSDNGSSDIQGSNLNSINTHTQSNTNSSPKKTTVSVSENHHHITNNERERQKARARQHAEEAQAARARVSEAQKQEVQQKEKVSQEAQQKEEAPQQVGAREQQATPTLRQTLKQPDITHAPSATVNTHLQITTEPTPSKAVVTPVPIPVASAVLQVTPTDQNSLVPTSTPVLLSSSTPVANLLTYSPSSSVPAAAKTGSSQALSGSSDDSDQSRVSKRFPVGATVIIVIVLALVIFAIALILFKKIRGPKASTNVAKNLQSSGSKKKKWKKDDEDEDMFGGREHMSMGLNGFGGLGIASEKTLVGGTDSDSISNKSLSSSQYSKDGFKPPELPSITPAHRPHPENGLFDDLSQYVTSPGFLDLPLTAPSTTTSSATFPISSIPSVSPVSPLSPANIFMNGRVYVVERTFEATLADELLIFVGDRIQVHMTYDDGWCLGQNLDIDRHQRATNQILIAKGVFPRDCLGIMPMDEAGLDQPLNPGTSDLPRTLTLPPLDLGQNYTSNQINEQDDSRLTLSAQSTDSRTRSLVPGSNLTHPQIRISSPSVISALTTPRHSEVIAQFPNTPNRTDNEARMSLMNYRNSFGNIGDFPAHKQQRVSSLISSRDAQLFIELGEALGHPSEL